MLVGECCKDTLSIAFNLGARVLGLFLRNIHSTRSDVGIHALMWISKTLLSQKQGRASPYRDVDAIALIAPFENQVW